MGCRNGQANYSQAQYSVLVDRGAHAILNAHSSLHHVAEASVFHCQALRGRPCCVWQIELMPVRTRNRPDNGGRIYGSAVPTIGHRPSKKRDDNSYPTRIPDLIFPFMYFANRMNPELECLHQFMPGQRMLESAFITSIDCRFPYDSPIKWRRAVNNASAISANATFMVIHELCRPPKRVDISEARAREILHYLLTHYRHPLLRILRPAIESHLQGRPLPVSKAKHLMRDVACHPGQYNALSICYFSCDDKAGLLDPIYDNIIQSWESSSQFCSDRPHV